MPVFAAVVMPRCAGLAPRCDGIITPRIRGAAQRCVMPSGTADPFRIFVRWRTIPIPERTGCSPRCPSRDGSAGCRNSRRWTLPLGQVLYESGDTLSHVYFPDHGHRLAALRDGKRRLGRDRRGRQRGHGRHLAVHGRRIHAQPRGGAKRRPGLSPRSKVIKSEFKAAPVLHLLLRYTQALITQMAQTAVCNRTIRWTSSCAAGCC